MKTNDFGLKFRALTPDDLSGEQLLEYLEHVRNFERVYTFNITDPREHNKIPNK